MRVALVLCSLLSFCLSADLLRAALLADNNTLDEPTSAMDNDPCKARSLRLPIVSADIIDLLTFSR